MAYDESLKVGNVEQFQQALTTLQRLGSGAQESNAVLRREYGSEVADDVAMIPDDLASTGRAIQDLLSTLPGVAVASNQQIRVNLANLDARSLITSSQAVGVTLAREGKGLIDADISFHDIGDDLSVALERQVGNDGVRVKIIINKSGSIVGGSVDAVEHDEYGVGYTSRGNLTVDMRGNITSRSGKKMIDQTRGLTKLNVPQLLSQITSTDGLDQPIDVGKMLTMAQVSTPPAPAKQ